MNHFIQYTIALLFESSTLYSVISILIIVCAIVFIIILAFYAGHHFGCAKTKKQQQNLLKTAREDAVKRARAVIGGQISEQVAPFLPGFPCDADDVRFIGKPIDFIAFTGLGSSSTISEILFIEVKTGNSVLSPREKEIKKAVEDGRIRYIEYRI